MNIKEFYILGHPINTRIGDLHFITVEEYPLFLMHSSYLTLDKDEFMGHIKKVYQDEGLIKYLDSFSLFELIIKFPDLGLYAGFKGLFALCFKADVFDLIENETEFEEYRELIKKINMVKHEKPNPNPEIEKFNRMRRMIQQSKNGENTFESMVTSVWTYLGERPFNMTLYQFYQVFGRISQFKSYDTSTLFATVSSEAKIEPWYKAINFDEEKHTMQTISEQELKFKSQKKL